MPVSSSKGKETIKDWFSKRRHIKTIVDLGPGVGTYPKLLGKDRYVWKAVEIWGPYVKRFKLNRFYDEIRIGDIQYMDLPDGDCAILGDVLEHIKKKGAIKTFKKVDRQFPHVVVSMPLESDSQHVFEGNEFERHISVWTKDELDKLIPPTYKVRELFGRMAIFIK